jgi:hypothetical protein
MPFCYTYIHTLRALIENGGRKRNQLAELAFAKSWVAPEAGNPPITEKRKSRNRLVSNLLACEHLRTISYTTFDEGTERNKGGNNRVDIRGIDLKGK